MSRRPNGRPPARSGNKRPVVSGANRVDESRSRCCAPARRAHGAVTYAAAAAKMGGKREQAVHDNYPFDLF